MNRSFTDRVVAGVCGGIAAALRINGWWVRGLWLLLTPLTLGLPVAVYLALWWSLPQESLVTPRRSGTGAVLLALLVCAALVIAWLGTQTGQITGPGGESLLLPVTLLLLGLLFMLRQARVRT
ncbi:MAG: PspC domain-containing protein [Phototrophicaceae bacterium]